MFIWYKKGGAPGRSAVSGVIRHLVIGVIVLAVIGGVAFFLSNSKDIISTAELENLAAAEGYEYAADGDNGATVTAGDITGSVMVCASSEEASEIFREYCDKYPKEDADNTQSIDFGSYSKYSASGTNGVIIAIQIDNEVAVVMTDNGADEDAAKELFNQIVK